MVKLSICIPVYNFDIRELVSNLHEEIYKQNLPAEIIIIDDHSESKFKALNTLIQHNASKYIELDTNIGRSKIRNLFVQHAKGEYFLYLDCDGKVITDNFLAKYLQYLQENPATKVIYGGRKVNASPPDFEHMLRWKFAVERENLPVVARRKKPFLSFQTNNFLIKKEVLQHVLFNAEFNNYGYEDLLFAMDLKSNNIAIDHIDNPIFNNDIETNKVYVAKVKESVNSVSLMMKNNATKDSIANIKLIKTFKKIHFFPLNYLVQGFFSVFEKKIEKKLLKGTANLRYLDLYKLGLLFKK